MANETKDVSTRVIPCAADAPRNCPVEGPFGWYTRSWHKGEKEAYKRAVLMKPDLNRGQ